MSSKTSSHFFFMGCWNNDNCVNDGADGNDYRSGVIKMIQQQHIKSPYDFGIVAGDNVYPHKPTVSAEGAKPEGAVKGKVKYYYEKTLKYGTDALKNAVNCPLYYALGNHDVVKQDVLEYHKKHLMPDGWMYVKAISKDLRVVVVDTNLLQRNITETIRRTYGIQTAKEGFARIQAFLQAYRAECAKTRFHGWSLVVGHEPLLTVKQKIDSQKKTEKIKVDSLVLYDEFLMEMAQLPNPVYMCADVHAFQVWNMKATTTATAHAHPNTTFQFPMVVVGTGGAQPDENPTNPILDLKAFEGTRLAHLKPVLIDAQPSYGYADVRADANQFRIRFCPLKYCSGGQYDADYILTKDREGIEKVRSGAKYEYDAKKCATVSGVKPTADALCRDRSTEKPMDGGGRYNRRMNPVLYIEYVVYQGRRHRIHRDADDRRRKYIQTKAGRIYAPHYHSKG